MITTIEIELTGVANGGLLAEIMAAVGDETVGLHEVAELIAQDSVLATEVLRMANSRYYGLAGVVQSVRFACTVVGSLGLRSITLTELGRRGGRYPEELNEMGQAIAARAGDLAEAQGVDPQVATAAGLVVNLGRILIAQQDPLGFAEARHLRVGEREGYEREHYGETALEITVRALARWHFPEEFIASVAQQPGDLLGSILMEAIDSAQQSLDEGAPSR
ncbi:MAG: HDOD domain-containing protein [Ferrimicrobium sp.]|uniref:HDOD domain-containing protein n=1 Tax=Ferrimicrobium acidiphilum TaxID=121039 RepID=A0ABV3XYJ9_9ACTN|nr:HDOD domain-containing protein [Ferrimicrobium sp.]